MPGTLIPKTPLTRSSRRFFFTGPARIAKSLLLFYPATAEYTSMQKNAECNETVIARAAKQAAAISNLFSPVLWAGFTPEIILKTINTQIIINP